VVGVGLSFSLWLLQSWHQSAELGEFSVLGLIAVGTDSGYSSNRRPKCPVAARHFPLDRTTVEKAIAQAESMVSQLEAEAENHESLAQLRERVAQLSARPAGNPSGCHWWQGSG